MQHSRRVVRRPRAARVERARFLSAAALLYATRVRSRSRRVIRSHRAHPFGAMRCSQGGSRSPRPDSEPVERPSSPGPDGEPSSPSPSGSLHAKRACSSRRFSTATRATCTSKWDRRSNEVAGTTRTRCTASKKRSAAGKTAAAQSSPGFERSRSFAISARIWSTRCALS